MKSQLTYREEEAIMEALIRSACEWYGIPRWELVLRVRTVEASFRRFVVMMAARSLGLRLESIHRPLGLKDHGTVRNGLASLAIACERGEEWDVDVRNVLANAIPIPSEASSAPAPGLVLSRAG